MTSLTPSSALIRCTVLEPTPCALIVLRRAATRVEVAADCGFLLGRDPRPLDVLAPRLCRVPRVVTG